MADNNRNIETVIEEDGDKEVTQHDINRALGISDGENPATIIFKPSFQKFQDFKNLGIRTMGEPTSQYQKFQNTMQKPFLKSPRKQASPEGDGTPAGAGMFYNVGAADIGAMAKDALVDAWEFQRWGFSDDHEEMRELREATKEQTDKYHNMSYEMKERARAMEGKEGDPFLGGEEMPAEEQEAQNSISKDKSKFPYTGYETSVA